MERLADRPIDEAFASIAAYGFGRLEVVTEAQKTLHLNEGSDDSVVLTTEDSDRFMRTQREIVCAMRGEENIFARSRQLSEEFNAMVRDIQAWCRRQPTLVSCTLCPRMDDVLAVLVASDEDDDDKLDDAISALDLEMFNRTKFRMTWLMLRASEAHGISSFVQSKEARVIYHAK